MAEYIDREKTELEIQGLTIVDPAVAAYAEAVLFILRNAPAADVAPVVFSRPVRVFDDPFTGRRFTTCAHCDGKIGPRDRYCKHCGAKMHGGVQ